MEKSTSRKQPLQVYLCGGHSTGKTTLQEAVCEATRLKAVAEVARQVITRLGLTREKFRPDKHPDVFENMQVEILQEHARIERERQEAGIDSMFDRCVDPFVYAMTFIGEEASERLLVNPVTEECINRYRNSLVFVLVPHQECFHDDQVRLSPKMEELQKFTDNLILLLERLKIPYGLIDVLDLSQRVDIILQKIIEVDRADLILS